MQKNHSPLSPIDVDVARLPAKGRHIKFDASAEQCSAIAENFNLLAVENFSAELKLTTWRRDGVKVEGALGADIIQRCVVTLDPVPQQIRENISYVFVPEGSPLTKPKLNADGELMIDPDGEDTPDTYNGSSIDLSTIMLETLALAIDPHPRSEGASLDEIYQNEDENEPQTPSPFAVLEKLKNGKND